MAAGLPMMPVARAVADAMNSKDTCTWCACVINCGQRCALRVFSHNGQVIRIETDNSQPDTLGPRQLRACQRGRSMRERIYSPDRLRFPMKRVGNAAKASSNASRGMRRSTRSRRNGPASKTSMGTTRSTGSTARGSSRL
ncbi:MAG: hypothetical protein V8S69_01040 [Dakarella massiliensis]